MAILIILIDANVPSSGYPAEIYGYGIQIFMNTVTFVLVVPLSVYFFMTVFYDMKLTSVYEVLSPLAMHMSFNPIQSIFFFAVFRASF